MPKVWIVQRPKHEGNFDHDALKALGEIDYLLPAVPNIMDQRRISADIDGMARRIGEASPSDIFVVLGGSPLSQMMFGAAIALAGNPVINYGLYSRGQDPDGRRGRSSGQRGSYRVIPVSLDTLPA